MGTLRGPGARGRIRHCCACVSSPDSQRTRPPRAVPGGTQTDSAEPTALRCVPPARAAHLGSILLSLAYLLTPVTLNATVRAYITNQLDNSVSVIDVSSRSVLTTIPVSSGPRTLAIVPSRKEVYVSNPDAGGAISIVDADLNSVVDTITGYAGVSGGAATPDGSRVYVGVTSTNMVIVIDTSTRAVITSIPVGNFPFQIAVSPDGLQLYVSNLSAGTISVISTISNTVQDTILVGTAVDGLQVTPDGASLLVTNENADTVTVINTGTNSIETSIPVGDFPVDVAITPDGMKAYVSNESAGTVSIISIPSRTVVGSISVGAAPYGVDVTPDGTELYVVNRLSDSVSVVDTATDTVVDTIGVGSGPRSHGRFIADMPLAPTATPTHTPAPPTETPSVTLTPTATPTAIASATSTHTPTVTVSPSVGGCAATPLSGCEPPEPGKGLFLLKNSSDDTQDKVKWKWLSSGSAEPLSALGDPTTTTSYTLCVYAGSAAAALAVPAGSHWEAAGKTGFRFEDATGTPHGVRKAKIKLGAGSRPKALVKGRGVNVPDTLVPPLALPVIVQMVNTTNDLCFSAFYGLDGLIRNDVTMFKGKATVPNALP